MKISGAHLLTMAGLFGATAVAFGAFGAHGIAGRVSPADMEIWKTAAQYHLAHSAVLAGVGIWSFIYEPRQNRDSAVALTRLSWVALCFAFGMLIFSGSLYALVLTNVRWLGAITPVGGTLLIGGWILLSWTAWAGRNSN